MAPGSDCHTKNTEVRFGDSEAALLRFPKDCVDLAFDYFHSKCADVDISEMNKRFDDKGCMNPSLRRDCAQALLLAAKKIEFCRKNQELFDLFKKTKGWSRQCHTYTQLSERFADDLFKVVFKCKEVSVTWEEIVLAIVMTVTFVRHGTDGNKSPDCIMATFSGLYLGMFKVLDGARCLRGWDCFLEHQRCKDESGNGNGIFQSTNYPPAFGEPSTKCGKVNCSDLACECFEGIDVSSNRSRGKTRTQSKRGHKRDDPCGTLGSPSSEPKAKQNRSPSCGPRDSSVQSLSPLSTRSYSSKAQPSSALGGSSNLARGENLPRSRKNSNSLSSLLNDPFCDPCSLKKHVFGHSTTNRSSGADLESISPITQLDKSVAPLCGPSSLTDTPRSLREEFSLPIKGCKFQSPEPTKKECVPLSFATEGRELVINMLERNMDIIIPRDIHLYLSYRQMRDLEKRNAAVKTLLCRQDRYKNSKFATALQKLTAAYCKFCERDTALQDQICIVSEILGGLLACIETGNWQPVDTIFIVLSELVQNLTITNCPTLKMLSEAAYHTFLDYETDILRKLGRWEQFAEQEWC